MPEDDQLDQHAALVANFDQFESGLLVLANTLTKIYKTFQREGVPDTISEFVVLRMFEQVMPPPNPLGNLNETLTALNSAFNEMAEEEEEEE